MWHKITLAKEMELPKVIIMSDYATLVIKICCKEKDLSYLGHFNDLITHEVDSFSFCRV